MSDDNELAFTPAVREWLRSTGVTHCPACRTEDSLAPVAILTPTLEHQRVGMIDQELVRVQCRVCALVLHFSAFVIGVS